MFYTYSIKNIENDKFYIGCRTAECMLNRRPEDDLGIHYFSSTTDKELRQAIKDGKVEYHVLQEYDDTTICWRAEQQLIALYWKFFGHDMSYNYSYINSEGEKIFSFSGKHHSEETKKQMSFTHNNKSDEEKEEISKNIIEGLNNMSLEKKQNLYKKRSEANSGKGNGMYGKHHSEATKEKISDSLKGVPSPIKGKQKIKFYWQTPDGEIRIMNKIHANRWHPDWTLIGPVENNKNN